MEGLDTKEQMEAFADVVVDEFAYYDDSPNLAEYILDEYGGIMYGNDIRFWLNGTIERVLRVRALCKKYDNTPQPYTTESLAEQVHTPQDWVNASTAINQTIENCAKQMKDSLSMLEALSQKGQTQLTTLQNGLIDTMRVQYQELSARYMELEEEKAILDQWYEDWQKLKQKVEIECYDSADVKECGGLDDPSLMRDAVEAILDNNTSEKKLKKENAELRSKLENWQNGPDYQSEIAKYKKEAKKKISIEEIAEGLKNFARMSHDRMASMTLWGNLQIVLAGTVFSKNSMPILNEISAVLDQLEQGTHSNTIIKDSVVYGSGSTHDDHSRNINVTDASKLLNNE